MKLQFTQTHRAQSIRHLSKNNPSIHVYILSTSILRPHPRCPGLCSAHGSESSRHSQFLSMTWESQKSPASTDLPGGPDASLLADLRSSKGQSVKQPWASSCSVTLNARGTQDRTYTSLYNDRLFYCNHPVMSPRHHPLPLDKPYVGHSMCYHSRSVRGLH